MGILRRRLGSDCTIDGVPYGRSFDLNGVRVSLHAAGHLLGSAQVRIEKEGEVWVFTGDYKRQADPTCAPFELVRCHTLITECTFGLPIFRWREPDSVMADINEWWRGNVEIGRTSLLMAYTLGKAQRLLASVDPSIGPILLHGAVHAMVETYRESGVSLPHAEYATLENAKKHRGKALVIAPPAAAGSTWVRKFGPTSFGVASGWMQVRGMRRRRAVDRGFVVSDHIDWPALMQTIEETGAEKIIATHGYTAPLVRYLTEQGKQATAYATRFTDQGEEEEAADEARASSP